MQLSAIFTSFFEKGNHSPFKWINVQTDKYSYFKFISSWNLCWADSNDEEDLGNLINDWYWICGQENYWEFRMTFRKQWNTNKVILILAILFRQKNLLKVRFQLQKKFLICGWWWWCSNKKNCWEKNMVFGNGISALKSLHWRNGAFHNRV